MKAVLLSIFLFLFSLNSIAQTILYVDSAATGQNNGTTWANAYNDLQDALETAQPNTQIWVAKGSYWPTKNWLDVLQDWRSNLKTFKMRPGVRVLGGFNGTETQLNQRDWRKNKTRLTAIDPDPTMQTAACVVFFDDLDQTSQLDGFWITDGHTYTGDWLLFGAGITIKKGNPILGNLIIRNNRSDNGDDRASGGISVHESSPYIYNCVITNNFCSAYGGGLTIKGPNLPGAKVVNTLVANNMAIEGGGISLRYVPHAELTNVTVSGNRATSGLGSALRISTSGVPTDLKFKNCIIDGTQNLIFISLALPYIRYYNSMVLNSGGSSNWDATIGVDDGGNLDIYPQYRDTANGDYRLDHCSPLIEAGKNTYIPKDTYDWDFDNDVLEWIPYDLDANERRQGNKVDMGAYEGIPVQDTVEMKLCVSDSISIGDTAISTYGFHTVYVQRAGKCDSIVVAEISPIVDASVGVSTDSLSYYAMDSNATYQWYDCTNHYALPTDTNQSFTPWIPSVYRVIVTKDGCTDTSACITVNKVSLNEPYKPFAVNVYPNPSSGIYKLQMSRAVGDISITVMDLHGKLILKKQSTAKAVQLNLSDKPAGVYILQLSSSEMGTVHRRLWKE